MLECLLFSWQKVLIKFQDARFLFFSWSHTFPVFLSCLKNNDTITGRLRLKDVQLKASLSNTVRLYTQERRKEEKKEERKTEMGE